MSHVTTNQAMYRQQLMSDTQQIFDFYCDAIATDLHNIIVETVSEILKDKTRKKPATDLMQKDMAEVLNKLNHCLDRHYQAVMGRKIGEGKLKGLEYEL